MGDVISQQCGERENQEDVVYGEGDYPQSLQEEHMRGELERLRLEKKLAEIAHKQATKENDNLRVALEQANKNNRLQQELARLRVENEQHREQTYQEIKMLNGKLRSMSGEFSTDGAEQNGHEPAKTFSQGEKKQSLMSKIKEVADQENRKRAFRRSSATLGDWQSPEYHNALEQFKTEMRDQFIAEDALQRYEVVYDLRDGEIPQGMVFDNDCHWEFLQSQSLYSLRVGHDATVRFAISLEEPTDEDDLDVEAHMDYTFIVDMMLSRLPNRDSVLFRPLEEDLSCAVLIQPDGHLKIDGGIRRHKELKLIPGEWARIVISVTHSEEDSDEEGEGEGSLIGEINVFLNGVCVNTAHDEEAAGCLIGHDEVALFSESSGFIEGYEPEIRYFEFRNETLTSSMVGKFHSGPSGHVLKSLADQFFETFDENRDGELQITEFRQAIRTLRKDYPGAFPRELKITEQFIAQLMTQSDASGEKVMSMEEFYELFHNLITSHQVQEEVEVAWATPQVQMQVEQLFLQADKDKDGELDINEFKQAMKYSFDSKKDHLPAGFSPTDESVKNLMKALSPEKNTTSREDFKKLVKRMLKRKIVRTQHRELWDDAFLGY